MKKRYLAIALASLFSMSLLSCQIGGSISKCDPDFEDCDTNKGIELRKETNANYIYDDVDNSTGSVSYEIFVRSFCDSNNDGIGDLNGITSKLDYLKTLGVSNLWLMPIHPSPSYHGYDVADYYGIHPDYGTMADFENLVYKANQKGIKIMIDMVLNHSSTNVSWFNQSYNDFKNNNTSANSKKDWYNWSRHSANGYANYNGLYYEARFDRSMPDLNTKNPAVRQEIDNILHFWINKGVKGFRLDAVKFYDLDNWTYNNEFLTFLKQTTNKYDQSVQFVGECWGDDTEILNYTKSKCDSFFNFSSSLDSTLTGAFVGMVKGGTSANRFANWIEDYEKTLKTNNPNGYSSYFLSNHDMNRASNSFYDDYAYPAASLYLLMPGTPYIYYGEEILMEGYRLDGDNSDARRRLPMVWSSTSDAGECQFPERNRMDLANNEQVSDGVYDQLDQDRSVLNHYRKVINVRNKYPFLKDAIFKNETSKISSENEKVLAYSLTKDNQEIIVIHNFNKENIEVGLNLPGYQIKDSIAYKGMIPTFKNGKLGIGGYSTIILQK